ncbi:DUF6541 family protein [Arsenicicoccus cauae]|uniref:DUF6541 family protein n=1 Tax=Arsenicicoccus cauae TaxID=2663847 RepID=UPI00370D4F81
MLPAGTTWWAALPVAAVSLVLHVLPGALVLLAARAAPRMILGAAPVVSAGVVGAAVAWTTWTGVRWGAIPLLLTTVVLGGLTLLVVRRLGGREPRGPEAASAGARLGPLSTPRSAGTPALATVGPVLVAVAGSWWVLVRGIASPAALQQSHDAGFHVNALARVLAVGDAGWYSVGATSAPASSTTFYPPGLHAHAALVAQLTGAHPVVVLNVVMLVLAAVVWPVGMLLLVREILGPDPVARWAVAAMLPVTLVFPTLLLHFGVLWSNAAGLALAPGLLALLVAICRRDVRLTRRAGWSVVATGAGLGLALVHPSAVLSVLVLGVPLLVPAAWRQLQDVARHHPNARRVVTWATGPALLVAGVGVVLVARTPTVRSLLTSRTRTVTETGDAVREVLTLGTHLTPGWLVLALLVAVGAGQASRTRRGWLVVGLVLTACLYVCAASISTGWGTLLTALWDREPYRVVAPLAVPALVLAGTGVSALVGLGARLAPSRPGVARGVVAVVVAVAIAAGIPSGAASSERLVSHNYGDQPWWRTVVSQREAALYGRVLGARPDGLSVAGDPFGGGQWAGVLSGHPSVFTHFGGVLVGDHDLLRRHLREMTPQVCRAVRDLHVGYVVEDTDKVWDNDPRYPLYAGLRGLAGVPGLQPIGHGGSVTVYQVTGCAQPAPSPS